MNFYKKFRFQIPNFGNWRTRILVINFFSNNELNAAISELMEYKNNSYSTIRGLEEKIAEQTLMLETQEIRIKEVADLQGRFDSLQKGEFIIILRFHVGQRNIG